MRATATEDIVVILHGIGQTRLVMNGLSFALKHAGYRTHNISYPSTRKSVSELAEFLHHQLQQDGIWDGQNSVHFVTHSLGGVILHYFLTQYRHELPQSKIGRVVMLGPPHQGSEVADFLKSNKLYQRVFGPAGHDLLTHTSAQRASPSLYELGIIAGTSGQAYILTNWLVSWNHSVHDGRVTSESTKIAGMKDHLEMPVSHSMMIFSPTVCRQIIHFLQHGVFHRDAA